MHQEEFSLFAPSGKEAKYKTLTKESINDLSVDFLCESLTQDPYERNCIKELLINITDDKEIISYRRDVFEDFLRFPELRDSLTALLLKLKDLREIERFQKDTEASYLWQLVNRLREMDSYIDCITSIKDILENIPITSQGLKDLRARVQAIYSDSGFPELKKDIEETMSKARTLRSITLGVNLDNMLRPQSVGVISLNDKSFTDSGLIRRFMNFASNQSELNHGTDVSGFTSFHPANPSTVSFGLGKAVIGAQNDTLRFENSSLTGADPMSDALKKVVTDILKRTVNNIKSVLHKYTNVSGYSFVTLMPQIVFYIRFAELCDKIIAKGLPLTKAEITPKENRSCDIKGIYNVKLAIKAINGGDSDIVLNDFKFDESARIYILTGPNRGGKTTITQAVGLAYLLAQNGIYVPAESATISPCDNIYTHFPAVIHATDKTKVAVGYLRGILILHDPVSHTETGTANPNLILVRCERIDDLTECHIHLVRRCVALMPERRENLYILNAMLVHFLTVKLHNDHSGFFLRFRIDKLEVIAVIESGFSPVNDFCIMGNKAVLGLTEYLIQHCYRDNSACDHFLKNITGSDTG